MVKAQAQNKRGSAHAASRLAKRAMGGAALSAREIQVLTLIAAGKSNKEGTVKTHVLSIHEKLGDL